MENSHMKNFKKNLQLRIIILTALMLCLWVVYIFSFQMLRSTNISATSFSPFPIDSFRIGAQVGIGIGLYLGILYHWAKAIHAFRNPEKLKLLYIAETDERKLFIKQKAGRLPCLIISISLATATVIAGSFNHTIFITLLITYFFVCLVHLILKLYYHWNY